MNKVKLLGVNLLFAALFFAGCDPKENITPDEPSEWPVGQNVYVAGFENVADNSVARLWKNGATQNLGGVSDGALRSAGTVQSEARSVFVSGNDVYVVGYDMILGMGIKHARLWKNGVLQNLQSEAYSDEATAVFVSGSDVYVLGREEPSPLPPPTGWTFKVWKNGIAENFTVGTSYWQVNSIFVSDGDVYVAGCVAISNGTAVPTLQAKLWKNGVEEDLVSSPNNSCANSVFVSGGDVYVAGYDGNEAILWKNGEVQNLTDGTKWALASSVYISGSDVYVAGQDGNKATLWKNGIAQSVAGDKDAVVYNSIYVSGNDVYMAGSVATIAGFSGGLEVRYLQAALWKNGTKLNLDITKDNYSKAFSVFVK